MRCTPSKAFFRPGELIRLELTFETPMHGAVEATLYHLADITATWTGQADGLSCVLEGMLTAEAPRGYGVTARLLDGEGRVVATAITAFDVLERWTQAPRYGFLSEFGPGRNDAQATMDWAVRYHLNGLQYYDWQYRHERLLPPAASYSDLLGRSLSLDTVKRLVAAGHERGIAAMPYTAIYGASDAFYREHSQMALTDRLASPFRLGESFLVIMNPASPWAEHLLGEFAAVLDNIDFDGIHIDQYGAPFVGQDASGTRIDLSEVFPAFIDKAAALVEQRRGGAGAVIFNAVGNWPVDRVAGSAEAAVYIEIWPPYREFLDLHRIVVNAQQAGAGKPVIVAAYIDPVQSVNWRLADAVIFASGGYRLELGEPGAMLADPYFPKFGQLDRPAQDILKRYYDFQVRYEEVLSLGTQDGGERKDSLKFLGKAPSAHAPDILTVMRRGNQFETFNLINFTGLPHQMWDTPLAGDPAPCGPLEIEIVTDRPLRRIWWASPDEEDLSAHDLGFRQSPDKDVQTARVEIPRLAYWDMIVVEYAH
jgi:dextranase